MPRRSSRYKRPRSAACLPPPAVRYAIGSAGTGTVLDQATGLNWQQTASGVSSYSWSATAATGSAQSYCASVVLGSFASGWRVPTVRELLSIVDRTTASPALNVTAFPDASWTSADGNWSSTASFAAPNTALLVRISNGWIDFGAVAAPYRVRCVHD